MPKEMIYPVPNPDGTNADTRVEVGWARDQYVQVATVHRAEAVDAGAAATWDGWYVTLNRYQINDLIRVLRRARDQAFGRDE